VIVSTVSVIPRASVHGRFQPLHLEHLDYLRRAFSRASYVYVGITQFRLDDLRHLDLAPDEHRSRPENNPLTFFERSELLRAALHEDAVDPARYQIIPFPIEIPEELPQFLDRSVPIFTTYVDEWNAKKADLLREHGYTVEVLVSREPARFSGSMLRSLMIDEDSSWKDMVPSSTIALLQDWKINDRLRRLASR
jgi:nicotinamide mononucleotide adenylyltransferase